jgi:hypothetical protein
MKLYLAIAALALYGDLPKRFLGSTGTLVSYVTFGLIIAACFSKAYTPEARFVRPSNTWFSTACLILLAIYVVQALTNLDAPAWEAFISAMYIVLPLTYIVVIARRFPQFDLHKLAHAFMILMPPILAVALVQYFINGTFLIDTTYSEDGGVIGRNFLDNDLGDGPGSYNRYPSLFASADRLSAMGMMQLFFCALLMHGSRKMTRAKALWLLFNLASALAVLMIAGARSRILIIGAAIVLAAVSIAQKLIANARRQRSGGFFIVMMIFIAIAGGVAVKMMGGMEGALDSLPIIRQLNATAEHGDVWVRLSEALDVSAIPEDVTLFGLGLGVAGVGGRPGEFALRAMWIESGVFWTTLMLLMHTALVFRLMQCLAGAFRQQAGYGIFLCAIPLFTWMFGLMAGLSGTFELSTALTLFPFIAVTTPGVVAPLAKGPIWAVGTGGHWRTSDGSG